jgi:hypothetical protein
MQKSIGILFIFLCIAVIIVAGCTNKESVNATPQIVYVTVLVTPTPEVTSVIRFTPEVTESTITPNATKDEAFLDYLSENQIMEGMTVLAAAIPGEYSISTGYNAGPKNEAVRLTSLLVNAPLPESENVKALRSAMMDALSEMDGSTAGFSRYRDAMQTVILTKNAAFDELYSAGSHVVNAIYISGHGDDVRSFNVTETGLKIFTLHHTGDRNFAITLKDDNGKYISLLVNEIGDYSGKNSERLTIGKYWLNIKADGDWTIGITYG